MKALKLISLMLVLGVFTYKLKANANDLDPTIQLRTKLNLKLAQANLKDATQYFNSGIEHYKRGFARSHLGFSILS